MNKALFNLPVLTAAAFSIAATAVIVVIAFEEKPTLLLDTPWPAPDFAVTDHNGETITRQSMLGKVWVCDFFLTRCNGVCPILGLKMAQTTEELSKSSTFDEVKLVSFSVDPEHDTLDIMRDYRETNFPFWDKGSETLRAAMQERWVHSRAEDQQAFWSVVQDGFKLHVGPASPDDPSTPIAHSKRFVLIDRQGTIRGLYDAYSDEELSTLIHDVRRLVNEPTP